MKVSEKTMQKIARRTAIATAVGSVLGGPFAYAQTPPATQTLGEVTVTATKRSENLQTVPFAISAISGDDLQNLGITDILDFEKAIPGLKIANSGNDPAPILRGAGVAGTTDIAVPFYVDGIYRPRSGQGLASFLDIERVEVLRGPQGTLFGRNTYGGLINITSKKPTAKEFDKGVALTVGNFSARRLEGFVNVPLGDQLALRVTASDEKRDPFVENTFNSAAGLKDAKNRYARAQLLWKPSDTFSATLGFTYWRDTANGNADFAYKCLGIPVNATTRQLDGVTGFLDPRCGTRDGWAGGRVQAGNVDRGDVSALAIQDPYKIAFDYKPQRDIKEDSVTLRLDWQVLNHDLTVNAAKFKYRELRLTDSDLSQKAGLAAGNLINSKAETVDVTLNSRGDGPLRYTLGAYLYDDSKPGDTSGAFLFGYTYTTPQKPTWATFVYQVQGGAKSTALYGQATYALTDKLSATGGVRSSKDVRRNLTLPNIRSTLGDFLPSYGGTPTGVRNGEDKHTDSRVSVQYQIDKSTMIYAYRATGYISGGTQALTQKLLDPQEAETYEAGIKTTLMNGRLRLNAAYFKTDYTGLTTTIFVVAGAAQTIIAQQIPGGSTKASGLELEGQFAATDKLRLTFGMAANESKFKKFNVANTLGTAGSDFITPTGSGFFIMDGKKTAFSPDLTGNIGASYSMTLANGTFVPSVVASYSSSYRAMNAPFFFANQPGYTTFDLAGTWRSADGNYVVRGFVNNATDKTVLNFATVFSRGRAMGDYNNPRTFGIRLAYNF